jgi:uncharacterized protein YyaL (SSP411 family)
MAAVLDRPDYRKIAEDVFLTIGGLLKQYASGFGRMLGALDFYIGPSKEIALVGNPDVFLPTVRKGYMPRIVVAAGTSEEVPLLRNRPMLDGKATAYVCENFTCKQPVTESADFEKQLSA